MHKDYPWTCGDCGELGVYPLILSTYNITIKREGNLHDLTLKNFPMPTCQFCGTQWTSIEQCDLITEEYERTKTIVGISDLARTLG